jgi:membrane-bound metal-dependent hydrolase YbcI (DUF457 family)
VDIEVVLVNLMHLGKPSHRYSHTFLIGTAVGAVWGLIAYFGLPILHWFMKKIRIPYQTNSFKMIISGILGVWLHVLIDGIYHYDVRPFWPIRKNYLWQLLSHNQVEWICIICLGVFVLLYILSLKRQIAKKQ